MKLYNPFKPHIICIDDTYFSIRQLTFYGWSYFSIYNTCRFEVYSSLDASFKFFFLYYI